MSTDHYPRAAQAETGQASRLSNRRTAGQRISLAIMKLIGWRITGVLPDVPKYLMIGAPHTTNIDFFLMLLLRSATGVNIHFVGKESLFRGAMGAVMRKLGGISVNRNNRSGFVNQIIELFASQEELVIAIAPEGTRGYSYYWKSGFYYMATGAGVTIQLVGIDYATRQMEIGPMIWPSGDIRTDMELIRNFYQGKRGKYPAKQGKIEIEPGE